MQEHFNNTVLFASILLLLSACATEDDAESHFDSATLSGLWDKSFSGCGLNCHSPDAADGTENGPDLSNKDKFHTNLVGKSTSDFPGWIKNGDCDNVNFISPGNADKSSLPASLIESSSDALAAAENCTTSFNIHVVNQVTIDNSADLLEWINSGAANN